MIMDSDTKSYHLKDLYKAPDALSISETVRCEYLPAAVIIGVTSDYNCVLRQFVVCYLTNVHQVT
jgi:hypothetical protein